MDRNQVTGLLLISVMLIAYLYFFSDEQPAESAENTVNTEQVDTSTTETASIDTNEDAVLTSDSLSNTPQNDSLINLEVQKKWGVFASFIEGEGEMHTLENDFIKVVINSKGAKFNSVELKEHKTWEQNDLILLDNESHKMQWLLTRNNGEALDISEFVYQAKSSESEDGQTLSLIANSAAGEIRHDFTLSPSTYELKYDLNISGFNSELQKANVKFLWYEEMKRFENVLDQSRNHTAVNYYTSEGDFKDVTNDADPDKVVESGANNIKWFSMKQKYFNAGLISENEPMQNATFSSEFDNNDSSIVKSQFAQVEIPFSAVSAEGNAFRFYFGPNNFSILKKVTEGYGENIYLGWAIFATVNKYTVVPFFNFLENYIANYGIIILILVFVVKLILSPLSYRSYVSMAKMKVLRPEIEKIKEKIGDDQQKVQMETMQLYQKFGVNPLSGCVPMVLQIPVLFALFNFFPNSIELRQKSFLWADDLSTYDSILDLPFTIPFYGDHVSLFTLLMTLSTLGYTYVQNQNNPMQQQGPMKTMQYFFPVMIMFFLNNFSSGLTYYYFLSNIITISQQLIIARFIDDKAIRDKLETRKKNRANKKKTGFSARLEEAMKAQQEAGKKNQKKGKKK